MKLLVIASLSACLVLGVIGSPVLTLPETGDRSTELRSQNFAKDDDPVKILRKIIQYLSVPDYLGLVEYLKTLPETHAVLDWLEENRLEIFLEVCWIFDACGSHDLIIDPITMQRVLWLIENEDWDGLIALVESYSDKDLLLAWIKDKFPTAWAQICDHFGKC